MVLSFNQCHAAAANHGKPHADANRKPTPTYASNDEEGRFIRGLPVSTESPVVASAVATSTESPSPPPPTHQAHTIIDTAVENGEGYTNDMTTTNMTTPTTSAKQVAATLPNPIFHTVDLSKNVRVLAIGISSLAGNTKVRKEFDAVVKARYELRIATSGDDEDASPPFTPEIFEAMQSYITTNIDKIYVDPFPTDEQVHEFLKSDDFQSNTRWPSAQTILQRLNKKKAKAKGTKRKQGDDHLPEKDKIRKSDFWEEVTDTKTLLEEKIPQWYKDAIKRYKKRKKGSKEKKQKLLQDSPNPTIAASDAGQMQQLQDRGNARYVINNDSVCFDWDQTLGTIEWEGVVEDIARTVDTWDDSIPGRIKENLNYKFYCAYGGLVCQAEFLIYLDKTGVRCNPFDEDGNVNNDGDWYTAFDEEVVAESKIKYQEKREKYL